MALDHNKRPTINTKTQHRPLHRRKLPPAVAVPAAMRCCRPYNNVTAWTSHWPTPLCRAPPESTVLSLLSLAPTPAESRSRNPPSNRRQLPSLTPVPLPTQKASFINQSNANSSSISSRSVPLAADSFRSGLQLLGFAPCRRCCHHRRFLRGPDHRPQTAAGPVPSRAAFHPVLPPGSRANVALRPLPWSR